MRHFGTYGPVNKIDNYVVARSEDLADFIRRIKLGRYIVLFAPRQTGKTTFFQNALNVLIEEAPNFFPIQLNFEAYQNLTQDAFYVNFAEELIEAINKVLQKRGHQASRHLTNLLENPGITDHLAMRRFFVKLPRLLGYGQSNFPKIVLIIDEFDGIPRTVVSDFLHILRRIYLTGREIRSPYSLAIVGVKNITQLDYDLSISPFNIQDDFTLPNFTLEQVNELLAQYTEEVGQQFAPEVVEVLHKQTGGQPFLVNRFAQILTEELDIPKTETIQMAHFLSAYEKLLVERNTNISHLITNIRRDPRFEKTLMRIAFHGSRLNFTLRNEVISELATYGIIGPDEHGICQILSPIYLHCIIQAFKPLINGLENEYLPEDGPIDFTGYIKPTGEIQMNTLLENFKDFIARAGFKILQVPDTPQEFVGQYLLFAYLDEFVKIVRATMRLEVQTGRGRADIVITHNLQHYIIETKIWRSEQAYQAGKQQLTAYLKLERETQGYYIVFDHRQHPNPKVETDVVDGCTIHSYVIPVLQDTPSISSVSG